VSPDIRKRESWFPSGRAVVDEPADEERARLATFTGAREKLTG